MDAIDQAMAPVFDLPDARWQAAIDELCREHPDLAAEVQRRFRILRESGLVDPSAVTHSPALPDRLDDFLLGRVLGEGGMGIVCEARQEPSGREVAIKLVRPGNLLFPGARERFRREVDAIAKLSHPGIITVLGFGEARGVPYYAMERLHGAALDEVLRAANGRLPDRIAAADLGSIVRGSAASTAAACSLFDGTWTDACLAIAIQVADALAHAHAHGVIHRDVKPSNIVVTVDGRVVLLDFGLAMVPDPDTLTRTGVELGSVPYMAPEVIAGRPADARSDQYALAVVLYESLAGRHPFLSATKAATRARAALGGVPPLRAGNRQVPRDLDIVLAKALDPDPRGRYGSMGEFAAELVCIQQRQPIAARSASVLRRSVRWARRQPALAACLLLGLLLVLGTPTAIAFSIAAQRDRAVAAEMVAARHAYAANIAVANTALRLGEDAEVRRRLERCPEPLRGFEWRHLQLAVDGSVRRFVGHAATVVAVAITDGAELMASADVEGRLLLWQPLTDRPARTVALPAGTVVGQLAFSGGGRWLVAVGRDQSVAVIETGTAAIAAQRPAVRDSGQVILSADGSELVVTHPFFSVDRLDPHTLTLLGHVDLEPHGGGLGPGVVVRDGWLFLPYYDDLQRWRLADGRSAVLHHALPSDVYGTAAAGNGSAYLSTSDRQVLVLEPGASRLRPLTRCDMPIDRLALDRSGKFLVGTGTDAAVRTWRTSDGRQVAMAHGAAAGEHAIAIAARRGLVAVGGAGGTLQLFAMFGNGECQTLRGHSGSVDALAVLQDGRLLSGSEEPSVRFWEPQSGLPTAVSYTAHHWVTALAATRDGSRAFVAYHGTIQQLRLPDLELVGATDLGEGWIRRLLPLPDGRLLAATADIGVLLVEPGRGTRQRLDAAGAVTLSAVLDSVAGQAWVGGNDAIVRFRIGSSLEPVQRIPTRGKVWSLALRGDDRVLFAAEDQTLCARSTADGSVLWAHECLRPATCVCLLADGSRLVSGHEDGSVCLWDVEDGQRTITLHASDQPIRDVVADPDGHWVAAASVDSSITVFRAGLADEPFAAQLLRSDVAAAAVFDEELRQELVLRKDVLAAVDDLQSVDAGLRQRMRTIELLRPPVTWEAVRRQFNLCIVAGRPAAHYEQALRVATATLADQPGHELASATAAYANLRLGRHAEALHHTDAGLAANQGPPTSMRCILMAVRAMALQGLGQVEAGRAALAAMRRLAAGIPGLDAEDRRLLQEAERTLGG